MKPEIHLNMSRADYDRRGEVNFSSLKVLGLKTPAHYHAGLLAPVEDDTDARQRGRAVHSAVLEPTRFRTQFVTWNDGPRNPKSKKWIDFQLEHAGKEIITQGMYDEAIAMARAAQAIPAARPYLMGGKSEVTVLWPFVRESIGPIAGYEMCCKSRLDFVADCGAIVDLKTTRDASPGGFGREVARYAYHVQAAFYRRAYQVATGKLLPYKFVAIEAAKPHVGAVYSVTDEAFELGETAFTEWMDRLHACQRDNHWPAYGDGEMALELPHWLVEDDDESTDLTGLVTKEAA